MRRHRKPQQGDGTAWVVVDRLNGDYLCHWYASSNDGHLVEHARVASASDAVAWGRLRKSRARIRTADARTYLGRDRTQTPRGHAQVDRPRRHERRTSVIRGRHGSNPPRPGRRTGRSRSRNAVPRAGRADPVSEGARGGRRGALNGRRLAVLKFEWNALRTGDKVLVHDSGSAEMALIPGVAPQPHLQPRQCLVELDKSPGQRLLSRT